MSDKDLTDKSLTDDLAIFEAASRDEDVRLALKQWANLRAVVEAYPAGSAAQIEAAQLVQKAAHAIDVAWRRASARARAARGTTTTAAVNSPDWSPT